MSVLRRAFGPRTSHLAALRVDLLRVDRTLLRGADPAAGLALAARLATGGDPDPHHGTRVAALAVRLSGQLGWTVSAARQLGAAAALHDIGKHALPRSLLEEPGPLSARQRAQLVLHTQAATWLLGSLRHPVLRLAATVGRSHHERWDGLGYPDRTAGIATPLPARIVAVCDVWDALTHPRPYRPAFLQSQARTAVQSMAGTALDPELAAALLALDPPCETSSLSSAP